MLVPPLVPSGVSPLAPACLMFAAVCLDASPPSSHRFISSFMLGYVPFPSACLGSCLSSTSPRHRYRCLCCCRLMASRYPPRLIDTTGGEIRRGCGCSLGFACLLPSARHLIRAFGIGWRRGAGACLASWPSSVPPATRSLAQFDFLAVLSSFRPIISSPSLPDRSTRGTGRGLLPSTACLCGSFAIAVRFRLRSICAGSVEDGGGGCLACLDVVLCMLSMG